MLTTGSSIVLPPRGFVGVLGMVYAGGEQAIGIISCPLQGGFAEGQTHILLTGLDVKSVSFFTVISEVIPIVLFHPLRVRTSSSLIFWISSFIL
jgi:hypothetical protein